MSSSPKRYEDIVSESGIASSGLVKGTIFIHPKGWHIWECIRSFVDREYGAMGIRNVALPALIPLSEMEREKEELSGFRPELFLVSRTGEEGGGTFLRPTSEILFSHLFRRQLTSYAQLPLMYNQWCSVYRSEKNTKIFLRSCEFHWQEAHTLHGSEEEASRVLSEFHGVYRRLVGDLLGLAFLEGEKTVNERFQGAERTMAIEVVMPDGQALQIATSHMLGRNFSRMFRITYTDRSNRIAHPFQLSAGSSTRLIGALVMGHSDEIGLVLPFGVADVQVKVMVVAGAISEGDANHLELKRQLADYRVEWEMESRRSFGFRLAESEVAGIPLVVVVGARELAGGRVAVKSRMGPEKEEVELAALGAHVEDFRMRYMDRLRRRSEGRLRQMVVDLSGGADLERVKEEVLGRGRVVLVPWFDDGSNEESFKGEGLGFGPRCIRSRIEAGDLKCFYSGRPATAHVYFGRSY